MVNKNCLALQEGSPRVPVSIHLDGDGICDFFSWIMRYIISTTGSINLGTSFENLKDMYYAAQEYGRHKNLAHHQP